LAGAQQPFSSLAASPGWDALAGAAAADPPPAAERGGRAGGAEARTLFLARPSLTVSIARGAAGWTRPGRPALVLSTLAGLTIRPAMPRVVDAANAGCGSPATRAVAMTIISAVADLIRNCDTRRIMPMQSRVDMLSPPAAFSPRVGVMQPRAARTRYGG
jgi:hypothetical protein